MVKVKLLILILVVTAHTSCSNGPRGVIVCGDDQVSIIDFRTSDSIHAKVVWKWSLPEVVDLPEEYRKFMNTTDDCKPVDNNSKILITSSAGGVVLVDRETKRSLFYAHVPNAHSAAYLPGERIAVALSTSPDGNCIQIFNANKPEEVICSDSIYSGHGVIFIPETGSLFALGYNELRRYSLVDWESDVPGILLEKSWPIPGRSGHDLISVSDTRLILTTVDGVWNFNIKNEEFSPFSPLESVSDVKSINYDETTGQLIYTKGEISWWTHNIYSENPDKVVRMPDINIYKVRVISR